MSLETYKPADVRDAAAAYAKLEKSKAEIAYKNTAEPLASMGATHWNVRPDIYRESQHIAINLTGGTWNSYFDHPEGFWRDYTSVDHWYKAGRGDPLPEHLGDAAVAWILGEHTGAMPVEWLIWWGWWIIPADGLGWRPYNGWQGDHKGKDGHIHITYRIKR